MPSNFTPPNFHEDQPSSLETALATSIGARNPVGALGMLIPEAQRRSDVQGNYHDYMAQVNQQQLLNLQNNANENIGKTASEFMAHPTAGAFPWAISNHILPGGGGADGFNTGLNTAAAAHNIEAAGKGLGDMANAGAQLGPNSFGQFIPSADGTPPVTGVLPPSLVRAADVRGQADLQGKLAGFRQDHNTVREPTDPNSPAGLQGGYVEYKGDAATQRMAEIAQRGQQPSGPSQAVITSGLAKLHDGNPQGWQDVIDNKGKVVPDPEAPKGWSFQGKSGHRYH